MRITLFLSIIILISACKGTTLSISGKEEKTFISAFLDAMYESNSAETRPLHNYIDPIYLEKEGLKGTEYAVDAYSLHGYNIESYKDGIVTVLIWGDGKSWQHRLRFKLRKEKGQLFLVPSLYEEGYVTPWWSVDRDVSQ